MRSTLVPDADRDQAAQHVQVVHGVGSTRVLSPLMDDSDSDSDGEGKDGIGMLELDVDVTPAGNGYGAEANADGVAAGGASTPLGYDGLVFGEGDDYNFEFEGD